MKLRSSQLELTGEFFTLEKVTPEEFLKMLLDLGIEFKGSIQLTGLSSQELDTVFNYK